jgi:protein-tyrosine phosphatase
MNARAPVRHVPLEGVQNLRDLGGYTAIAGTETVWGVIYRSDSLHNLTSADRAELERRGVTTVIDLRRAHELEAEPNPFAQSSGYLHISLFDNLPSGSIVRSNLETLYDAILTHCGDALRDVLESIIAAPGTAVVHCKAGKDRTGLIAALLLGGVGVPDETIADDYALTTTHAKALLADQLEAAKSAGLDIERTAHFLSADRETMLETLKRLRERHGSVRVYLTHIGISRSAARAIRTALVEKHESVNETKTRSSSLEITCAKHDLQSRAPQFQPQPPPAPHGL